MPVEKTNGGIKPKAEAVSYSQKESACDCGIGCCGKNCCQGFGKRILLTLAGILLVYIIVFFGTLVRNNLQEYNFIGQADKSERTILVSGQGKVAVKPDIAVTSLGLTTEATTVSEAQKKNTETMNKLIAKLKELGIEDKDIQTVNYNIYPRYDYTDEQGSVLRGYQIDQSVSVKIRNLEKANSVLALAGEFNLNNVGGLQFTIDDKEVYKDQARELALEQVIKKAKNLSRALGVKIVSIVNYNEYANDGGVYPLYYGMGGSMMAEKAVPAPAIEAGSTDVIMNVDVTLEIK